MGMNHNLRSLKQNAEQRYYESMVEAIQLPFPSPYKYASRPSPTVFLVAKNFVKKKVE
jgi:hypothetical protein